MKNKCTPSFCKPSNIDFWSQEYGLPRKASPLSFIGILKRKEKYFQASKCNLHFLVWAWVRTHSNLVMTSKRGVNERLSCKQVKLSKQKEAMKLWTYACLSVPSLTSCNTLYVAPKATFLCDLKEAAESIYLNETIVRKPCDSHSSY